MAEAEDVVYAFTAAYNGHDVDRMCALCTEDVEIWTFLEGRAERKPFRGHTGIRDWHRSETEAWEQLQVAEPRARHLGEGRVLGLATVRARGRSSGVEIEAASGWIFDLRDRRIARLRAFDNAAKALQAAGLAQDADLDVT